MKKLVALFIMAILLTTTLIPVYITSSAISNTTQITSLACSEYSSAMVKSGFVYTWGRNREGQLGDKTFTDRTSPAKISGLPSITAVSAGEAHVLALSSTGTVYAWGKNNYGELGRGTSGYGTESSKPELVQTGDPSATIDLDSISQIAAGGSFSVALTSTGDVYTWGQNNYGQLGTTTTTASIAVKISSLSNIAGIAAGANHAVAIKNDGTIYAWGLNSSGQLGNGATKNLSVPTAIVALNAHFIKSVACGSDSTLAVDSKGNVWTWGNATYGQLGDGTVVSKSSPVKITNAPFNDLISVSAGQYYCEALKSDGTVYTWGTNAGGQLGFDSGLVALIKVPIPIALPAGFANIVKIASGAYHSLALKSDGTLYSWGNNTFGQLAVSPGVTASSNVPIVSNLSVSIKIPDTEGKVSAGIDTVSIPVLASFSSSIAGFEFDIGYTGLLPGNITSVTSGSAISAIPNLHVDTNIATPNVIRVTVYSDADTPIVGPVTDAEIIVITFDATVAANHQSLDLTILDAKASVNDGTIYPISQITNGKLYLWQRSKGDLDNDLVAGVLDVDDVIDIILLNNVAPADYEIFAADYDSSGGRDPVLADVTISDALKLLYDILN